MVDNGPDSAAVPTERVRAATPAGDGRGMGIR